MKSKEKKIEEHTLYVEDTANDYENGKVLTFQEDLILLENSNETNNNMIFYTAQTGSLKNIEWIIFTQILDLKIIQVIILLFKGI